MSLAEAVAFALVSGGIGLVYLPAGLICAGTLLYVGLIVNEMDREPDG